MSVCARLLMVILCSSAVALKCGSLGCRTLYYGGERRDRYGRALAQVFEGETYLQEEMVRKGLARVYTWPDTWQDSARLLAAEQEARAASRGMWGLARYKIRSPEPNGLAQDVDSFQIVEGKFRRGL